MLPRSPRAAKVPTACTGAFTGAFTGDDALAANFLRGLDFRPAAILDKLNLRQPIFSQTTNYGHFGKNDPDITWEKTDKAAALKRVAK